MSVRLENCRRSPLVASRIVVYLYHAATDDKDPSAQTLKRLRGATPFGQVTPAGISGIPNTQYFVAGVRPLRVGFCHSQKFPAADGPQHDYAARLVLGNNISRNQRCFCERGYHLLAENEKHL